MACWYWRLPPYDLSVAGITELIGLSPLQHLHALVQKKIITHDSGNDSYTFFNASYVPSLIHKQLEETKRAQLHDRIAEYLIASHPDPRESVQNAIALHRGWGGISHCALRNVVALGRRRLYRYGDARLS